MNIELIILLVVWLVSIEVIFFVFMRNEFDDDFIVAKLLSILSGTAVAIILFAFPYTMSISSGTENNPNLMAYVWYYGIALSVAAFFSINYAIHKWLEGMGK